MEKNEMREVIAKRAAKELHDGDVVNLGIGIPTMIPNYLPEGVSVTLQTENGAMGMGPSPEFALFALCLHICIYAPAFLLSYY